MGAGSFGVVYMVRRKEDKKMYVMKVVDTRKMSHAMKRESALEAIIMSKINCQYVCRYYDSFVCKDSINIIMQYCENGDLGKFLKRQMNRHLNEGMIWKFFIEMCLGLRYLHSNKILHRDIKTINMFLTKDNKIKIGDLGVAKMLN